MSYEEFNEEIRKLTEQVEYLQDENETLMRINRSQQETINSYHKIVLMKEAEIKRLGEEA
jgi:hypothetical protein